MAYEGTITKDELLNACKYWLQETAMITGCEETKELLEKRVNDFEERRATIKD